MNGEIKQLNDIQWMKIEYDSLVGGIQIKSPREMIGRIWGATVEVRLADGTEKTGFANPDGVIRFE